MRFLKRLERVDVNRAVHVTRHKATIVFEPVDGANLTAVSLTLHVVVDLHREEVVDMNRPVGETTSKEMTTVGEFDFLASLQL